MTRTNGSGRSQRNNPYQLDELIVKIHRSAAGIAWRWRTELLILGGLAAALWRLSRLDHHHLGRRHPGRRARHRLRACRSRGGSSPAGSGACWPATGSTGCAGKPGCTPAPDGSRRPVDPAHQGRRALTSVPGGHLRRGLRRPHRRTARRLLRPRSAGHPQPPLVPAGDHRHHPPRHPRGQPHHRLPAGAADRATTTSASPQLVPPSGLSPTTARARPHNPARRSPGAPPGGRLPRPEGGHHDRHRHPAAAAVPVFPFSMFDPVHLGTRRVRRARPRQPGRTQHAARRRARRRQILRAQPDHRARRAVR